MSIVQVWERLFIGTIGDAEALADSNPHGITTVVTLCPEAVPEEVHGIHHRYLPMLGNRPLLACMFAEFIAVMFVNIRSGKVLIHSLAGANRSPIMAAAWMDTVGYKDIDAALAEIGTLRTIEPNPTLLSSIKELL